MDTTTSALLDRAIEAMRAAQWGPAQQALQDVLRQSPDDPVTLQLLGVVAFEAGRADDAIGLIQRAIALAPDYAEAHYNLATIRLRMGQAGEAAAGFRRALALDPRHFGAQLNLGGLLSQQGRLDEALEAYRQALAIDSQSATAHMNYANILKDLGRSQEAATHYQTALRLDPKSAEAHNNIGLLYRELGQLEAAAQAIERAIQLAPDNPQFKINLRDTYRRALPNWHFRMLADEVRNDAYRRAIEKAAPGRRLALDIGTGSGLLAMMAARAGAAQVVACEMIRPLARAASRIVARNGYGDRITVVAKKSTQLAVGADLPERADLLISEIVDGGLLGEGMLRTLRHANNMLAAPDAAVIPMAATVWGALIESADLRRQHRLESVAGFDLGELDMFRNPLAHHQFDMAHEPHRVLSRAAELARFDFRQLPESAASHRQALEIVEDGTAQAIAFWFDLKLDEEITLSTRPGAASHWRQAVVVFDRDRPVRRGEHVDLLVGHTDSGFRFDWPEPSR